MPIQKVLIANRGEIACRIIRAARQLGISSVGVYSTADVDSLHVRLADEAVEVGPPPSSQSYLNIPRIVEAATKTGSQAIHPGYGFLSENPSFVESLDAAGITFIGPSASAMHAMGDKIGSKKLAMDAGVNTIPGFIGEVKNPEEAVAVAKDIGFPVMVKASAGGGGKGMRIAYNADQTVEAFRLCKQEAASSFGDSRLLIEKFIEQPRHVEIQVMGDKHGNVLYFPERECSIQRRNQKVFEEAPSPLIDPETRRKMGEQAVSLAKAVDYHSAGTVEFLVSGVDKSFYFLEMNTRLQVEHPITEAVSGVDLAKLMFEVAEGKKLKIKQEDIQVDGWAMESRVYAENPYRSFLPSIGNLRSYREPALKADKVAKKVKHLNFDQAGVRTDSGIQEGGEVQVHYDPLISKLIVYGKDRESARQKMADAIDSYVITGVQHNLPFLRALLDEDKFKRGDLTTNFIKDIWKDGFKDVQLGREDSQLIQTIVSLLYYRQTGGTEELCLKIDDGYSVVKKISDTEVQFEKGASHRMSDFQETLCGGGASALISAKVDGRKAILQRLGPEPMSWGTWRMTFRGRHVSVEVFPSQLRELYEICGSSGAEDDTRVLRAPMPGSVQTVSVQNGDVVDDNQEVLVLEAMKMQNILRAPRAGKVKEIHCRQGDIVAVDSVLVEFEK